MASILASSLFFLVNSVHAVAHKSHSCHQTIKGFYWDLSPLQMTNKRKPESWRANSHDHQFAYALDICENVEHGIPIECETTVEQYPSPGYQMNSGLCKPLGKLDQHSWHLLDQRHPRRGIVLTYKGGEPCPNGREREMTFDLICAPHFHHAGPLHVVETKERCHYNITWPTPYACPRRTYFRVLLHLFKWALVCVIGYVLFRWVFNMYTQQTGLSLGACPHRAVWVKIMSRLPLPDCVRKLKAEEEHDTTTEESFEQRFPMQHADT